MRPACSTLVFRTNRDFARGGRERWRASIAWASEKPPLRRHQSVCFVIFSNTPTQASVTKEMSLRKTRREAEFPWSA